ncbi:MAG TPA: ABC transporter substrate-binding protein [Dehalococcoidia bacterium]|nr:ABC transporter substrate-binding protein [Dehalococcoidia bacterium]
MRRREVIAMLGGAAVWPVVARAQQAMPVIGFLHSGAPGPNANRLAGFRKGLREAGFVEGQNVAIEFRWADGRNDRLPELAADLISRPVAVIVTLSSQPATLVAKAATATIPIVFTWPGNPVDTGLVASLSRPGGNATGISTLNEELAAKRLGLLHELAPEAAPVSVLLNPASPNAEKIAGELQARAPTFGVQLQVLYASSDREIDAAFATLASKPGGALLVNADPFFFIRRAHITALAARHAVPTIYYDREFAVSGGLMSYGTDLPSAWGQAGNYVARILKGEKPAELPVAQPIKFELVINLKTAKALGLTVPNSLLARAEEVTE